MDSTAAPQVTGKKFVPHTTAARIRGVSTRTLDRWVAAGIVAPPVVINKRKYHDLENIAAIGQAKSSA